MGEREGQQTKKKKEKKRRGSYIYVFIKSVHQCAQMNTCRTSSRQMWPAGIQIKSAHGRLHLFPGMEAIVQPLNQTSSMASRQFPHL